MGNTLSKVSHFRSWHNQADLREDGRTAVFRIRQLSFSNQNVRSEAYVNDKTASPSSFSDVLGRTWVIILKFPPVTMQNRQVVAIIECFVRFGSPSAAPSILQYRIRPHKLPLLESLSSSSSWHAERQSQRFFSNCC